MKTEELIKKYNINLKKLEEEQKKLAKLITIKDAIDFSLVTNIAAIDNVFYKNQIISAIVVMNEDKEIVHQEYTQEKVHFPYLPGFRAYRELPAMLQSYHKLEEHPDVVIISGQGIVNDRLGLASHFSLASGNIPTIGLSSKMIEGVELKNNLIYKDNKVVGKALETKPGSKPLLLSPGNSITLESAEKIVLKYTTQPHKIPEPLRYASKFAKKILKEIAQNENSFAEKTIEKNQSKEENFDGNGELPPQDFSDE